MLKKKYLILSGVLFLLGVFAVCFVLFYWENGNEGQSNVFLASSGYDQCSTVDLSSMPVYKNDKEGRTCYRDEADLTWPSGAWTLEKGNGSFSVGCNEEWGGWRAYGIQAVDVSGQDTVRLKADLSTTSSLVHYDDYVDLVVFSEDKTSDLVGCNTYAIPDANWPTQCALTDLATDSLGHCGLPQKTTSTSCDLTLDVSGLDTIYLTFIAKDAWNLAFGVLRDSFEDVQICTAGASSPPASVYDSYDVYLLDETYDSDATTIDFAFVFDTKKEQTVTLDIKDSNGNFVNSLINSNTHLYPGDSSPYFFSVPIEWTKEGYYYVDVKVVDWTNWDGVNDDVVMDEDDYMNFYYAGEEVDECGDGYCVYGEICPADFCCNGVSYGSGKACCGGSVLDKTAYNTDEFNCGSCGNVCALDYECQNGVCVDVGNYDEDCGADCEEAQECAMGLSPIEGCIMEIVDIIPLLDKSAAVSLLGDDLCSLKERYEMSDPVGMAVTSVLMSIDLLDNALDFTIVGYGITVASDTVEGIIDCLEGILYQALKMCGGYTSCIYDVVKGVNFVTSGGILTARAFSPVELGVMDRNGNDLSKALVINENDLKLVLIPNPSDGKFVITAKGTSTGTYDLETNVYNEAGNLVKEDYQEDIPVSSGTIVYYDIDIPSDYDADNIEIESYAFSSFDSGSTEGFTDMSGHWAYNYVNDLVGLGVINGYPDNTFKPDQYISRAELLKICLEAFKDVNLLTFGESVVQKNNTFVDVYSTDWFYKYVTFAAYYDVVSGYGGNKFEPGRNITRAEAIKIILLSTGLDLPFEAPSLSLSDVSESDWFHYFVSVAIYEGYVSGYSDNTFRPNQKITRAEVSKIVKLVRDAVF